MRKRLTLSGVIAVIASLAVCSHGEEQLTLKLGTKRFDDRMSAPRLEMPELADAPEVTLQKTKPRRSASTDGNAQRRLRASLRKQKTKRVVATQN